MDRDITRFKAALAAAGIAADRGFMTAVSPGQAVRFLGNRYRKTHQAYLSALGAVLKEE